MSSHAFPIADRVAQLLLARNVDVLAAKRALDAAELRFADALAVVYAAHDIDDAVKATEITPTAPHQLLVELPDPPTPGAVA